MENETFSKDQIINAIESYLKYGEESYGKCQQGYFSSSGWAARCLRFHFEQLNEKEETKNIKFNDLPLTVIYKHRIPDPGKCKVIVIDWEREKMVITNGSVRLFPTFDEVELFIEISKYD